jgi:hypothetical protein
MAYQTTATARPCELPFTLCRHCDHFVEANDPLTTAPPGTAPFIHLEDGEQEFDHDPEAGDETHSLEDWQRLRPVLFREYPDGAIGPNSRHHSRRGKVDAACNL